MMLGWCVSLGWCECWGHRIELSDPSHLVRPEPFHLCMFYGLGFLVTSKKARVALEGLQSHCLRMTSCFSFLLHAKQLHTSALSQ